MLTRYFLLDSHRNAYILCRYTSRWHEICNWRSRYASLFFFLKANPIHRFSPFSLSPPLCLTDHFFLPVSLRSLHTTDNRALIWRLSPVLDTPQANTSGDVVSKLLCAVAGHEQSVNVVRWSPNGRWLATGSGDGRVGLAERTANPTEFGASAGSEVWRFRQYLTGSQMGACAGLFTRVFATRLSSLVIRFLLPHLDSNVASFILFDFYVIRDLGFGLVARQLENCGVLP